ncbi:polysaccharide deacetylase family protein [Metaclostridioides mangenotii]|uniref:Peptidoglycan/xylan/chitin deacetylase (PgdA/CDA1 family) n=1 Tax=Metaclostridioides mangenotii TaxID=1540 RepID=A0ABS4EAL0_9FIRM|nr:polysaccharide deacetylase family protein [Clostridioides mangenotii]MBP1854975.1 peptidoglycan/xylan/chitin deacetylase (PgdA/CDA1 family) [Clostridioides mangenotii]
MNLKNKKTIISLIIGLAVFISFIGVRAVTKQGDKSVQTSTAVELDKKDVDLILQKKTLSEIMYDTSQEKNKGPGATPKKVAYITIDDGPSKFTNELLDILNENDVKATFFLIDRNMKNYKKEVKRIVNEGNSLGFHSVSHDVKMLYKTPQATLDEFETCKNTMKEISGQTSNLIRLPYGSKPYMPESSYKKLVANGYLIWDWNLDTLDWKSSEDQIVSNVLYYGRDRDELVVLIHEKKQSVKALSSIIEILKKRDYTILPISENEIPKNYWRENLQ